MITGRIFVVIPAYNAEKSIETVFADIPIEAAMKIMHYVVIDDGSSDRTDDSILRLRKRYANLTALRHQSHFGYGAAVKTLFHYSLAAGAEIVLLLHAQGRYGLSMILDLLRPIEVKRADSVYGTPLSSGGVLASGLSFCEYLAKKCLNRIENWALGMELADYHSGHMAFSRHALQAMPFANLSNGPSFDLELIIMAKLMGLRRAEVVLPTVYANNRARNRSMERGIEALSVIRDFRAGKYDGLLQNRICTCPPITSPKLPNSS